MIIDWLDIIIAKIMIWRIKKGYGFCEESDLPSNATAKDVFALSRCPSCRAKEIVDWLEDHTKIIKM